MENLIYQILAVAILFLFPTWRIFSRAGLHPALSLTLFIPFIGVLVACLILIFSKWHPVAVNAGGKE